MPVTTPYGDSGRGRAKLGPMRSRCQYQCASGESRGKHVPVFLLFFPFPESSCGRWGRKERLRKATGPGHRSGKKLPEGAPEGSVSAGFLLTLTPRVTAWASLPAEAWRAVGSERRIAPPASEDDQALTRGTFFQLYRRLKLPLSQRRCVGHIVLGGFPEASTKMTALRKSLHANTCEDQPGVGKNRRPGRESRSGQKPEDRRKQPSGRPCLR